MADLFGRYCYIDTPWIAGKKTRYRIIESGVRSNTWCEVPVTGRTELARHDDMEDVVFVVLDTLVSDDSIIQRFALKDVEVIPADVRPVVRGRWEWKHRHRGGFRRVIGEDDFGVRHTITVDQRYEIDDPYCPFCKKLNESVFLNFCPNCGADMRGGDAVGGTED